MTDFATHSYTSTSEILTLLYASSLKKVPFSSRASPYGPLKEYTPPPHTSPARESMVTQNLVFAMHINLLLRQKSGQDDVNCQLNFTKKAENRNKWLYI